MGHKMSLNEDLIHSIKKLRVSNLNNANIDTESNGEVRFYDVSSPSSPFRKPPGGQKSILERATNAPFENSPILEHENESESDNITMSANSNIDHIAILKKCSSADIRGCESRFFQIIMCKMLSKQI